MFTVSMGRDSVCVRYLRASTVLVCRLSHFISVTGELGRQRHEYPDPDTEVYFNVTSSRLTVDCRPNTLLKRSLPKDVQFIKSIMSV